MTNSALARLVTYNFFKFKTYCFIVVCKILGENCVSFFLWAMKCLKFSDRRPYFLQYFYIFLDKYFV